MADTQSAQPTPALAMLPRERAGILIARAAGQQAVLSRPTTTKHLGAPPPQLLQRPQRPVEPERQEQQQAAGVEGPRRPLFTDPSDRLPARQPATRPESKR